MFFPRKSGNSLPGGAQNLPGGAQNPPGRRTESPGRRTEPSREAHRSPGARLLNAAPIRGTMARFRSGPSYFRFFFALGRSRRTAASWLAVCAEVRFSSRTSRSRW